MILQDTNIQANQRAIAVPLKRFLTLTHCPNEWRRHDLYLVRDDQIVFYVGQSYNAFERVWEHLRGSFKGQSAVGRFILNNWPRALNLTIELLSSRSARFSAVGNDLGAAERFLIARYAPCFNEALNADSTPLPEGYSAPNASVRRPRSLRRMIHDAEQALRRDAIS